METLWHYLVNQFINTTKENYEKSVKLSNYHDSNLNIMKLTEPLLVPVYNRYHPLHLTLVGEYNGWKSAGGSQKGKTSALKQLLEETYKDMPAWDVAVQNVFLPGTPDYISIFPNGRKPFTKGSIDDRINAYDTLAQNMDPYPPLAAVKALVEAAYLALDTARDRQEGAKGSVKTGSGKVEAARIAAMTMQWRDLGFAMDAFWDKTDYIESMFDLETLRESPQTQFTGTLDPLENAAVFVRTFLADDELRLKSNGNAEIWFCLSNSKNGTNSAPVKVAANTEMTIEISAFNVPDYGTYRHLTAVNQSVSEVTMYEVEIE